MRSNRPQIVTKKIVNKKVSISKSRQDKVKAALHEIQKMKKGDQGYKIKYESLRGRIKYLEAYHPSKGKKFLEVFESLAKPQKIIKKV